MKKRSIFYRKAEAFFRRFMVYGFSSSLPLYIVTEYPKSGGSWFSQILSDYLQIPFPRNRFPRFGSCIMHGHYLYFPTMRNVFVVVRDGRDIMVSYYFHCFFKNDRYNDQLVEKTRKALPFDDYSDIRSNLPRFIEYKFSVRKHPRFTWKEFVESWQGKKACFVKYEDLLKDTLQTAGKAIQEVCRMPVEKSRLQSIVEKYSFKSQTGRAPGSENRKSFLRKGVSGDWKNYFNKESKRIFGYHAGDKLIELGYEEDSRWADN
ncbi:MAG: sulfotransferase domain-containing protein [Candidatus Aureabacteria bacterium]|nr:sulfotransferase domain-containing protein [Candidatus Auribacterota bacterium]